MLDPGYKVFAGHQSFAARGRHAEGDGCVVNFSHLMAAHAQPARSKNHTPPAGCAFNHHRFGAALRVYDWTPIALLDEASSIKFAHDVASGIIENDRKGCSPAALYFATALLDKTLRRFETSARLLSALFGILPLLSLHARLARLLTGRPRCSAALSCSRLSRFHLEFSQEARMYALLCLLGLLSFYFFIKLFEDRKPPCARRLHHRQRLDDVHACLQLLHPRRAESLPADAAFRFEKSIQAQLETLARGASHFGHPFSAVAFRAGAAILARAGGLLDT